MVQRVSEVVHLVNKLLRSHIVCVGYFSGFLLAAIMRSVYCVGFLKTKAAEISAPLAGMGALAFDGSSLEHCLAGGCARKRSVFILARPEAPRSKMD